LSADNAIIDGHVALGQEHHLKLDVPELLREMDSHEISLAISRPLGAELVINNQAGNDRMFDGGTRIKALVTANPWYGGAAIDELKRCAQLGAVGLYLHPTRQGFMPTDPIVAPLIDFAAEQSWPVVFHTGTYINSDVLAVAELARRWPEVAFVCDSAGFTDMWFELPGLMEQSPNILLCTSLIWARAILLTVKNHGASRVLFGSGMPRDSLAAALRRIDRLELSPHDRRAILHDNAVRVFKPVTGKRQPATE
jgi:predicted TIM-barrel fold metal-dependent hydrolase